MRATVYSYTCDGCGYESEPSFMSEVARVLAETRGWSVGRFKRSKAFCHGCTIRRGR